MTIEKAITEFRAKLQGWWWSIGDCSVSADASCGPDKSGTDFDLLYIDDDRIFDEGFHVDLTKPASPADALLHVMKLGLEAKTAFRNRPVTTAAA